MAKEENRRRRAKNKHCHQKIATTPTNGRIAQAGKNHGTNCSAHQGKRGLCRTKEQPSIFRVALLNQKGEACRNDDATTQSGHSHEHIEHCHRMAPRHQRQRQCPKGKARSNHLYLPKTIRQGPAKENRQRPKERQGACQIAVVRCTQLKIHRKIRKEKGHTVVHQAGNAPTHHH